MQTAHSPTRMGSDTFSYVHYMALRRGCGGELTSSMKGRAEPWARDTYESVKYMDDRFCYACIRDKIINGCSGWDLI
jgi:hypothetical protein